MDFFENRYYNINRLTLSFIGFWPYQNLCRRLISTTVSLLIFGSIMLLTISKMIKRNVTLKEFFYCFQFLVPPLIIIGDVLYCFVNVDKVNILWKYTAVGIGGFMDLESFITYPLPQMKMLLEHIKRDWSLFEPCDAEIIEPYAEFVRMCNMCLTVLGAMSGSILLLHISKRSNTNSHSNTTDLIELLLPIQISDVNYNKYFPVFVLILLIILFWASLIVVACSAFYFSIIQHACGIFSITGRRMETLVSDISDYTCVDENKIIFKVSQSIKFHTKAIGFLNIVNAFFGPLAITQMMPILVLLSIELLQISGVSSGSRDFRNTCASLGHTFCALIAITLFCYTGQLLLDYSNRICNKIYSSQWYVAPLSLQKLIITVMIRSMRVTGLTLTKSLTVSFEMLATMLQMAVSYFMAISSIQQ